MQVRELNSEVLVSEGGILTLDRDDIEFLKIRADRNERKRIRVCAHTDLRDTVHEMLIVFKKGAYVRPHKHRNKVESFHIIEGSASIVGFDGDGNVVSVARMADLRSGGSFYYRGPGSHYHTLVIASDYVVFHETTSGPFDRTDTLFPPWAPEEADSTACQAFEQRLSAAVARFPDGPGPAMQP